MDKKKPHKEITLQTVLDRLDSIESSLDVKFKNIDKEFENLAISTARGFVAVHLKIAETEDRLIGKMDGLN